MSAFIVDKKHIDVIVSYFVTNIRDNQLWLKYGGEYQYLTPELAPHIALTLYAQNVRSVDVRYREENDSRYEFKYIEWAHRAFSIAEISAALDCLVYQSCETDDYHQTTAYEIVNAMRKHLLRELQKNENCEIWEITSIRNQFVQA